jgi:hypothetical protein
MHCYPSAVACASVVSALCGLGWVTKYHQSQEGLLEKLAKMVDVPETELMQELVTQIDRMVKDNFEGVVEDRKNVCDDEVTRSEQCTPPPGKMRDYKTATTPTDVHEVMF